MIRERRLLVAGLISLAVGGLALGQRGPDTPDKAKSRTFEFTYAGVVKDLKPGQEASVWLPAIWEFSATE